MKIGFTGSQGSGKTTLAKAMMNDPWFKSNDWKFAGSSVRAMHDKGFAINKDADPLSQLVSTVSRITTEYTAEQGVDNLVVDRTPLDSLAYTTYQYNNVWTDFNSKHYWQISYDLVSKHMSEYDFVFYFPPYWAPKDDGVRSADVEYQLEIDKLIDNYLDDMGIASFMIKNVSTDKRLKYIKSIVC